MVDPTKNEKNLEETPEKISEKENSKPFLSYFERYSKLERGGLNYIKKKKSYLIISAAFPIYVFIIEILTAIFFIQSMNLNPQFKSKYLFRILVPSFGGFFILILSLFHLFFLIGWRKKLRIYERQKINLKLDKSELLTEKNKYIISPKQKTITLTRLFYDIVNHMEKIKLIFTLFNIIALYLIFFSLDSFFFNFKFIKFDIQRIPFIKWLNFSLSIFIVLYLIFEWFHFIKWNRKLSQLREFEKKVFYELDL